MSQPLAGASASAAAAVAATPSLVAVSALPVSTVGGVPVSALPPAVLDALQAAPPVIPMSDVDRLAAQKQLLEKVRLTRLKIEVRRAAESTLAQSHRR